jgi:flagellar biosynthesis regulator FlbT
MQINDHIMSGTYYKALKVAKELIEHERELVENVLKKA